MMQMTYAGQKNSSFYELPLFGFIGLALITKTAWGGLPGPVG